MSTMLERIAKIQNRNELRHLIQNQIAKPRGLILGGPQFWEEGARQVEDHRPILASWLRAAVERDRELASRQGD